MNNFPDFANTSLEEIYAYFDAEQARITAKRDAALKPVLTEIEALTDNIADLTVLIADIDSRIAEYDC